MLTGVLAGLGAGALWGLIFVMPRMLGDYSGVDMTAGRFVAYGVLAACVMALGWRRRPRPTLRQAGAALGLSILGFSAYFLLLVLAIQPQVLSLGLQIIGDHLFAIACDGTMYQMESKAQP